MTKIQKWGNSLGLRIPSSFAEEAGVEEGSVVNISMEGNRIVIQSVRELSYKLDDLLAGVKKKNLHGEVDTGNPAGREVW